MTVHHLDYYYTLIELSTMEADQVKFTAAKTLESLAGFRMTVDQDTPKPECNLLDYDLMALTIRIEYTKKIRKRDITPRTKEFAEKYKEATAKAIKVAEDPASTQNDKNIACRTVFEWDR